MMMRRVAAVLVGLALATQPAAAQTVETFESFGSCDNSTLMGVLGAINYQSQFICYNAPQPPYTPKSGTARLRWNVGFSESSDAFFTFNSASTFQGAWFSGFSSATATFEMYLNNVLVGTSSTISGSSTPTFLSSNYNGLVDKVRLIGDGNNMILDDITYNAPSSTVPEPASLALVAAGLGALAVAARRRTR